MTFCRCQNVNEKFQEIFMKCLNLSNAKFSTHLYPQDIPVCTYSVVLCDTHDTSILIVDTYATIPVSPSSRYTAVYRSSTKYRETAQVSRVSSIPATYCIMSTCVRPILHETILPLCYSVLIFFRQFLFSPTKIAIEIGLL